MLLLNDLKIASDSFFKTMQELYHLLKKEKNYNLGVTNPLSLDRPGSEINKRTRLAIGHFGWVDFSTKSPNHPASPMATRRQRN
jgi:hypothetical protein